ncbi:double zinc ribbon domain-containing protein [Psychromonas sp. MME2]|uniref:double zinc ribbon domain-containing protein n=1 Tax=Psychromonas sp. MME2 TaxID=3231033 RepID=UPI00339BF48E
MLNSIYTQLKHKLLHLLEQFIPAQCLICQLASDNKLICKDCKSSLLQQRTCCQHCGLSLPVSPAFLRRLYPTTALFYQITRTSKLYNALFISHKRAEIWQEINHCRGVRRAVKFIYPRKPQCTTDKKH